MAPAAAFTSAGVICGARSRAITTAPAPDASAERSSAPTLRGSVTSSSTRTISGARRTRSSMVGLCGGRPTATMPWWGMPCAIRSSIERSTDSATTPAAAICRSDASGTSRDTRTRSTSDGRAVTKAVAACTPTAT